MRAAIGRAARTAAVLACIGLLGLSLSGCSGRKRAATATPAGASSSQPIPQPLVPPAPTTLPTYSQYPVPASVSDDPAKRKQVHIDTCSSSGTGAAAAGTVRNSSTRSTSYDITVFFTSNTATAVNYATTTVTVRAGAAVSFTAQRSFAAPEQLLCVLVGVS